MSVLDKLFEEHSLTKEECMELLDRREEPMLADSIRAEAHRLRKEIYGSDIFVRGLIEFTNICKQDCFYCGIRKSNPDPDRYRLKKKEILECCEYGYNLGFRSFVLQGGDDGYYSDKVLIPIVSEIKERYPDAALTLSIGERSFDSYKSLKEAGADRYLLRHETADEEHYRRLHPPEQSLHTRMNCLYDLKSLGYQVGAGFMVGSPYQTMECIAEDLVFLQELDPEMVGIGPFIPHHDTRFADFPAGSVDLTLFLLSVIRILIPDVLLPATTALATADPHGREKGIIAGANVVMPNISPASVREKYLLYDGKACVSEDTEHLLYELSDSVEAIGFHIVWERGDHREDPADIRKRESEDEDQSREGKKKKKKKDKKDKKDKKAKKEKKEKKIKKE